MGPLYHVALPEDWEQAQQEGEYRVSTRGRTLEDEGFIHCSFADQIDDTIARYYADVTEAVVLQLDETQLPGRVVEENGFPHVYGVIPTRAVTACQVRAKRRADGS